MGWAPLGAGTGEVKLKLYSALPIQAGDNIDASTVPEQLVTLWDTARPSGTDQTDAVPAVEAGTTDQLYVSTTQLDLSDTVPGQAFAYALRRNDSSDADSFASAVAILYIEAEGRFWRV